MFIVAQCESQIILRCVGILRTEKKKSGDFVLAIVSNTPLRNQLQSSESPSMSWRSHLEHSRRSRDVVCRT